MKTLIICSSPSHGNTRRVADRIAEVLEAEVVAPQQVTVDTIADYDLVGFGSGIYFAAVDRGLRRLVDRLPHVEGAPAFTFFTSGAPELPWVSYSKPLRRQLASKGFRLLDSFSCRGLDTVGPLRFIGGVNKGRPNDADLAAAAEFATRVRNQVLPPTGHHGPD